MVRDRLKVIETPSEEPGIALEESGQKASLPTVIVEQFAVTETLSFQIAVRSLP